MISLLNSLPLVAENIVVVTRKAWYAAVNKTTSSKQFSSNISMLSINSVRMGATHSWQKMSTANIKTGKTHIVLIER